MAKEKKEVLKKIQYGAESIIIGSSLDNLIQTFTSSDDVVVTFEIPLQTLLHIYTCDLQLLDLGRDLFIQGFRS